jgi:hypothetical protein
MPVAVMLREWPNYQTDDDRASVVLSTLSRRNLNNEQASVQEIEILEITGHQGRFAACDVTLLWVPEIDEA